MYHLCLAFEILLSHVFYLILELLVHQLKVVALFFDCGMLSATLAGGLKFGASLRHQLGDFI